jgi:hypothetical protein
VAVELARARALHEGAHVHFFVHNALAAPIPGAYDAVTCSLFLHHLDEGAAVGLLRSMASLSGGGPALLLVNDLDRTLRGLLLAHLAAYSIASGPHRRTAIGPRRVHPCRGARSGRTGLPAWRQHPPPLAVPLAALLEPSRMIAAAGSLTDACRALWDVLVVEASPVIGYLDRADSSRLVPG